jgi:hypothetical protein
LTVPLVAFSTFGIINLHFDSRHLESIDFKHLALAFTRSTSITSPIQSNKRSSSAATMRFSIPAIVLSLGALAAAQNPFNIPPSGLSFAAGQSAHISWTPSTGGTVTLVLRAGDPNHLRPGETIATGIDNSGSYSFMVPSSITKGTDYTLEIISDENPALTNYTPVFAVDSTNTISSAQPIPTTALSVSSGTGTLLSTTATGTAAHATSSGAAGHFAAQAGGAMAAVVGVMVAL